MESEGIAMDDSTGALLEAIRNDEWITGQEEVHVDEEGNLDFR